MTENVITLSGVAAPRGHNDPVPAVVELCEELLAAARAGEIVALHVAEVRRATGMSDAVGGGFTYAGGTAYTLMASVCRMKRRFEAHLFGGTDDVPPVG